MKTAFSAMKSLTVGYKHVDLKFAAGNCYGIIGANGAGKPKVNLTIKDSLGHSQILELDERFRVNRCPELETCLFGLGGLVSRF